MPMQRNRRNNTTATSSSTRRWKILIITLSSLSLLCNHQHDNNFLLAVRAEMQTGIFPRNHVAVKTYTDVLQIAQKSQRGIVNKTRQAARRARGRLPQQYGFQNASHNINMQDLQRQILEQETVLCGDICTMRKETPMRRFGLNSSTSASTIPMPGPFISTSQYRYDDEDGGEKNSKSDPAAQAQLDNAEPRSEERFSPSYVLRRKSRRKSRNEKDDSTGDNQEASTTNTDGANNNNNNNTSGGNPLIYRYWNRSRVRRRAGRAEADASIPFLILGPRVDHWKLVGKILASRGFNVIACERSKDQQQKGHDGKFSTGENEMELEGIDNEGEALVSSVLDALRWQRAVLVGCDKESILAMEAAMRLAPDRIAGMVFCGDLSSLEDHVRKKIEALQADNDGDVGVNNNKNKKSHHSSNDVDIDSFLRDYVECPCNIMWDGDSYRGNERDDAPSISLSRDVESGRSVIIGGGLVPHRRLPEQFAWSLTRFVENRVSVLPSPVDQRASAFLSDGDGFTLEPEEYDSTSEGEDEYDDDVYDRNVEYSRAVSQQQNQQGVWKKILPRRITRALDEAFAPGSLLVTGRMIATVVIYLSITRVSIFQYHKFSNLQMKPLLPMVPTSLTNVKWKSLVQAVPGIIMRRARRQNRLSEASHLDDLFQDKVDEHDKLEERIAPTTPTPSEEKLEHGEKGDMEDGDGTTDREQNIDVPPPPAADEKIPTDGREDRERERDLDNRLFHKFVFFDQIVS